MLVLVASISHCHCRQYPMNYRNSRLYILSLVTYCGNKVFSKNCPLARRRTQLVNLTVWMHSNNKRTNSELKNELILPPVPSRSTCKVSRPQSLLQPLPRPRRPWLHHPTHLILLLSSILSTKKKLINNPPVHTGWPIWSQTWVRLTWIWEFHHLAQLPGRFCQTPISPGRIRQTVE